MGKKVWPVGTVRYVHRRRARTLRRRGEDVRFFGVRLDSCKSVYAWFPNDRRTGEQR